MGVYWGYIRVCIYVYIDTKGLYMGIVENPMETSYSIPEDGASVQLSAHVVCKTDVIRMLRPVFLAGPALAIPMPFRTTPEAKP